MNYSTMPPSAQETRNRPTSQAWTVRKTTTPRTELAMPKARVTRRFETEWLDDGQVLSATTTAPAFPAFEQAFSAFSHGVLIHTTNGPIAVEDLEPGMHLECPNGRVTKLMWKGAITIVPGAPTLNAEPDKLYRVMSDSFGLGRPVQDQTFGPAARRLDRDAKLRAAIGAEAALVPLSAQADGHSVIEVNPVSPTRVYHLACETHETILAAGLEVETYHPGPETPLSLPEEVLRLFMTFFPHLAHVRDFGHLKAPRISADELAAIY